VGLGIVLGVLLFPLMVALFGAAGVMQGELRFTERRSITGPAAVRLGWVLFWLGLACLPVSAWAISLLTSRGQGAQLVRSSRAGTPGIAASTDARATPGGAYMTAGGR
jgi:hypothetical protein